MAHRVEAFPEHALDLYLDGSVWLFLDGEDYDGATAGRRLQTNLRTRAQQQRNTRSKIRQHHDGDQRGFYFQIVTDSHV